MLVPVGSYLNSARGSFRTKKWAMILGFKDTNRKIRKNELIFTSVVPKMVPAVQHVNTATGEV